MVISWDTSLLLVSLAGATITFTMDSVFALVPEIDCVRVVGNYSHEIVQKVPKDSIEIFGIGSVAPGSVLLEASKKFSEGSHKADEYIRMITDVKTAVEQCVTAAGHEFYPPTQKMLLKVWELNGLIQCCLRLMLFLIIFTGGTVWEMFPDQVQSRGLCSHVPNVEGP